MPVWIHNIRVITTVTELLVVQVVHHFLSASQHTLGYSQTWKYKILFLYNDESILPASSSCGNAPVPPLPAAGEPAPPGPDPQPDSQEGAAAASQHRAGCAFPSTRPFCPGIHTFLWTDQLLVIPPRSVSSSPPHTFIYLLPSTSSLPIYMSCVTPTAFLNISIIVRLVGILCSRPIRP